MVKLHGPGPDVAQEESFASLQTTEFSPQEQKAWTLMLWNSWQKKILFFPNPCNMFSIVVEDHEIAYDINAYFSCLNFSGIICLQIISLW